ncbi:MAG: response regulator [Gemmatimonadales bacterium]
MSPIRVLLAEDHTLVRVGISTALQRLPGVEIVGQASDGREAVALAARLAPDVVLMDIAMAGLNGLDATARIAKELPRVRVLILSMHTNEEYVARAFRVGAAGYLLKGADFPELELAIRAVARGETYLSPAVSRPVVEHYRRRSRGGDQTDPLTTRQREILQLLAEGRGTKDVARELGLSVKTIEAHRAQIMRRLGIYDFAGLVRYAIRAGVTTSEA